MRIERRADGALVIAENWPLLRATCVIGACLLPAALFFAAAPDSAPAWQSVAGAVIGSLLLLAIAAVVDDRRFIFVPSTETLSWSQRNWIRSRCGELPFSKIRDVVVTSTRDTDLDVRRRPMRYQTVLVTEDDPLSLTATSGGDPRQYAELADAVLGLLTAAGAGRPGGAEIDRIVAAGRMIDAIALIRAREGLTLAEAKAVAERMRNRVG